MDAEDCCSLITISCVITDLKTYSNLVISGTPWKPKSLGNYLKVGEFFKMFFFGGKKTPPQNT